MSRQAQYICSHCGLQFSWRPVTEASEDNHLLFCCRGCLSAWQMINQAGLGLFYQRQSVSPPRVETDTANTLSEAEIEPYYQVSKECKKLDLMINGITCPACVWLLERIILQQPGVRSVSLAYAARTATVEFEPGQASGAGLIALVSALGYRARPYTRGEAEQEAIREKNDLLLRFGTALFLTMQLMAYATALYAGYFQGIDPKIRNILQYASALVSTPVLFYSGWPFLKGAWTGLRSRMPGMDLLIAVGACSAWIYSIWALFNGAETYFESAAMIITFVLIGRLLELVVRRKALSGLEGLLGSLPRFALLLTDDGPVEIPVEQIKANDRLLVRQMERVPVDATLEDGETEIDESSITGEPLPVLKSAGDELKGGCLNLTASVVVTALRPVAQSYLMQVAAMVRTAQGRKPAVQRLADRVSSVFVPAVILLGLAVTASHLILGSTIEQSITVGLTVVLISCPCALGLAVPSAVLAACSNAAGRGVIIRGGDTLERLAAIDLVAFDKTGTLTEGKPCIEGFELLGIMDREQVLAAVASVEYGDRHPVSLALSDYAVQQVGEQAVATGIKVLPGLGVTGSLTDGSTVLCGNLRLIQQHGLLLDDQEGRGDASAQTVVYVAISGLLVARFNLKDKLKIGAFNIAEYFSKTGIDTTVLSGDRQEVVDSILTETGISSGTGEMVPDDKLAMVVSLQRSGKHLLMAGDGINDSPALAAASVSCVPASASDSALEQADIILGDGNIALLAEAHKISIRARSVIRQNLLWAFLYNMIGIPLAMAGLLTPVFAAAAMTASSLMVSVNSLRLLRGRHG